MMCSKPIIYNDKQSKVGQCSSGFSSETVKKWIYKGNLQICFCSKLHTSTIFLVNGKCFQETITLVGVGSPFEIT